MRVSEQFVTEYVTAEDLGPVGTLAEVTIKRVTVMPFRREQGVETKLILLFEGATKCLPLNVTNRRKLVAELGDETEDWLGRKLVLAVEEAEFQGRRVAAIRVRGVLPVGRQAQGGSGAIHLAAREPVSGQRERGRELSWVRKGIDNPVDAAAIAAMNGGTMPF